MTAPAPDAGRRHGWHGRSLRLRLTVLTAGLLCVTLAAGAVALTTVLSRSRVAALDEIVRQRVTTVTALVHDDRVPPALPVAEPGEIVQVLDASGRVVASSPNASRTLPVLPPEETARLRAEAAARLGAPADARSGAEARGGEGADASGAVLVGMTRAGAYDAEARVGVRPATYRGEPVTVVATAPTGEVRGLLSALRVSLLVVVPLLTLLLAVVIWVVLGRALHPVEQLRRAAAQVARSGGPGSLPVHRADDELGALARTLNDMLDRLEVSAARQRAFVADAAHELRSPVAALRAAIEVARTHPRAYTTTELAADLQGEVVRMQALVDDLLVLARVGSARRAPVTLDLAEVAHHAVTGSRPSSAADPPVVEVVGAGTARGDEDAVVRVVRNLVDNAVRHAASRVHVTVADGVVRVEDDGGGVAPEDRERVFERFVRLEDAREREAGGTGLGLAIAREIAREHGGDVVLSESAAGGLSATLLLPADP